MSKLDAILRRLKKLEGQSITVKAIGVYPVKRQTKVQDVAVYQNNGTTRGVQPAKFVETAEAQNLSKWSKLIEEALPALMGGRDLHMVLAGDVIARDIGKAVNRIDTHRLQQSMRSEFK